MVSRARWSVPLALGLVLVLAGSALAAVSWLDPTVEHPRIGAKWTWNYGSSLGVTDDGNLHTAYVTDYVGGNWVSDSGPYEGVYYLRGTVAGDDTVAWTRPKRVSPGTKHSDRSVATSEGSYVYVGYVTVRSYDNYDPAQPRVFYFRSNDNGGAATDWNAPVKMSPGTGRVDYPVIAAGGNNVYAIWTNSANGNMMFGRSTDNGLTWTKSAKWATTKMDTDDAAEGYAGWPGICADGNVVGIAWIDDPSGKISAVVSRDGGATFGAETALTATDGHLDNSWPQCAAFDGASDRVVFTWTNNDLVNASIFTNSKTVFTTTTVYDYDGVTYDGGYGPAAEFSPDGSEIGVAFTACKPVIATPCNYYNTKARVDLYWSEGPANGSAWGAEQLLGTRTTTRKNANLNDYPSIIWYDADTRFVEYNAWTPSWFRYQIHLQTGSGT